MIDRLFNKITTEINHDQTIRISKLHTQILNVLSREFQCIINKETLKNIKLLQALVLIEGLFIYMSQFGLDKKLTQKITSIRTLAWAEINYISQNTFIYVHQIEIECSVLFFAYTDELLNPTILKSLDLEFDVKPWTKIQPQENYKTMENIILKSSNHKQSIELTEMPQVDSYGCFIPSIFSQGGFIAARLDEYTNEFIVRAATCNGTILNIGSGYGIPERLSILLGAKDIICNDVCPEHLTIIKNLTSIHHHSRLRFVPGFFPNDIDLPNNSISVLGIFRVLHFLEPELITNAIKRAYDLLEPNGTLIISAETPYLGNWQKFIPEYENRVKQNQPWPGYISDTLCYETSGYSRLLPAKMHFLDVPTLTRVLVEQGFTIIKASTFDRSDTFPQALLLDGKESVGVIAQKFI